MGKKLGKRGARINRTADSSPDRTAHDRWISWHLGHHRACWWWSDVPIPYSYPSGFARRYNEKPDGPSISLPNWQYCGNPRRHSRPDKAGCHWVPQNTKPILISLHRTAGKPGWRTRSAQGGLDVSCPVKFASSAQPWSRNARPRTRKNVFETDG